ncbi:MAG: long-chain-acyl-CoA synthetase [Gammaproteobacteria bacterium]|nr:long-chain-acyl-CoA synthetase [Gammaproteobacteria bacterium]
MLRPKAHWFAYLLNLPSLLRSVPLMRLKADSHYTIADYIEGQAARYADRPFILFEERTISYREFNAMANRVAHWALSVGLRAGDAVGFMMTNRAEYVPVWSGLAKIGVKAALINTNLKGQSVLHALEGADATHLLVGAECIGNLAGVASALSGMAVHVIPEDGVDAIDLAGADDVGAALSRQPESNPDAEHREPVRTGDSAFYIYTSGTTGLPKAAKFNHQKLALFGMLGPLLGLRKGQVVYSTLPLYHGAGGVGAVMMAMGSGGVIAVARRFSASTFWDDVRRYDATAFMYIGEMCRFLLRRPASADDGRHNLRFMFGNGLRADAWTAFQDRFRVPRVVEAYGATESNTGAINFAGKLGSVGKMIGGAILLRYDIDKDELILDENGHYEQCADGEVGELVSRMPRDPNALRGQFQGYTSAEATERKILRDVKHPGDAYMRSGDLLRRDAEGYFYFVDRIGDTFRWKGENVSTQEVAEALAGFPGVETVNVYGVEVPGHEGRAGMAAIALEGGRKAAFDVHAFHELAVTKLPSYAVPVFLRLQSESEVTTTFKLTKVKLQGEGYDPNATEDPIYVRDAEARTYVRLHDRAAAYVR